MLWAHSDAINDNEKQRSLPKNASMELHQLRQFLEVARTLHFGLAAEGLGIAQPQLSRAIARLEAEVGARLFLRTSRRVQLTPAGEVLRGEATELVLGAQRAAAMTRQAAQADAAGVRIAFVSAALYGVLPALLRQLRGRQPALDVELQEASTEQQLALLARGDIDLGLGHLPLAAPRPRIVSELLVRDRFDALLPADHPLAARASVTFRQLATDAFVLFPEAQGPTLFAAIRDQCRLAGTSLKVAQTASRLHSQCALVAAGLGVGLAPRQSRSLSVDGTVRRPIRPYPDTLVLDLALLRDARRRSRAIDLCADVLRSQANPAPAP